MNAGVSENCSLICRVGRETARGLHSCAEVAPHPPLETKAPQRRGVSAEGGRAEGRGTGRGQAGAQLQASQGADGEVASRGCLAHPSPCPLATGRLCSRGADLVQSVCVCSHEWAWGVLPASPLTPGGWEQRLHSKGWHGRLTTRHPDSHADCHARPAPDGPGFLQAFSANLLLPCVLSSGEGGGLGPGPLGFVLPHPVLSAPLGAVCPHGRSFSSRALFRKRFCLEFSGSWARSLRFLPGPECVREPPLASSGDSRP